MQRGPGPAGTDTGVSAWARNALARLTDLPAVHRVGLALAEGGGRRLQFTASDRDAGAGVDWCHVDAYDDVPLNTAVRTGRPVLGGLDDLEPRYGAFVAHQRGTATVAIAAMPIVAAGETVGGYVLFFDRPQPLHLGQRLELTRLAEELGAALRRPRRGEESQDVTLADESVPPGALVASHGVTSQPAAVGEARRFLQRTLVEWGIDEDTTATAVLCLSELVTNAVIHAHADCVMRVLLDHGVLTTTVRDGGTPHVAPSQGLEDPLRVHGRGLQLVDALATRWGSELHTAGTTVWFELEP